MGNNAINSQDIPAVPAQPGIGDKLVCFLQEFISGKRSFSSEEACSPVLSPWKAANLTNDKLAVLVAYGHSFNFPKSSRNFSQLVACEKMRIESRGSVMDW